MDTNVSDLCVFIREISHMHDEYRVHVHGSLDSENTSFPGNVSPPEFRLNQSLCLENLGSDLVKNPRIRIQGGPSWFTWEEYCHDALAAAGPDASGAEKTRALFEFHIARHSRGPETIPPHYCNPLFFHQAFGSCDSESDATILGGQWKSLGLDVCAASAWNHSVNRVKYHDDWHLMDGDLEALYLLYDNHSLADSPQLRRDPWLVKRTHSGGLEIPDVPDYSKNEVDYAALAAAIYHANHTPASASRGFMPFTGEFSLNLRPAEKLLFLWENRGLASGSQNAESPVCNGRISWTPRPMDLMRFSREKHEVRLEQKALVFSGRQSRIVVPCHSPWPILGGTIHLDFTTDPGAVLTLSVRGKQTARIFRKTRRKGPQHVSLSLTPFIQKALGDQRNDLELILECTGARLRLGSWKHDLDLQMNPVGMPGLTLGENLIHYKSSGGGRMRITHAWRESAQNRPPKAPRKPLFPRDGKIVDNLDWTFQWEEARDPDGDAIADYHFVMSEYPDCRWALSRSFEKIISRTRDKGRACYTLPWEGLISPDVKYYWRVRARDDKGAWGTWSETWSFSARGPRHVENLRYRIQGDDIFLEWDDAPDGPRPVKYEIYGSDEQGFSPMKEPYEIIGLWPLPSGTQVLEHAPYRAGSMSGEKVKIPGNLLTTITRRSLRVVGSDLNSFQGYNRVFYRVAAIDERGASSGCGDFIELPHPFLLARMPRRIRSGENYQCPVRSLSSLGRISASEPGATLKLRNADAIRYSLKSDAGGFWINPHTGVLSMRIPAPAPSNPLHLTITARDRKGASHKRNWSIEVED